MKMTVEQAAKLLLQQDHIVILTHSDPDGDTIGAALGLFYALEKLGKRASVKNADDYAIKFACLINGQQNMVMDEENFIIAVDTADTSLLGSLAAMYEGHISLCIDHHPTNKMFAKHTLLDSAAAATCEIVYDVILAMGAPLDAQIASCLYVGLITDTGCFQHSNTTAKTHRIAAELIEKGIPYNTLNRKFISVKTRSQIELERRSLNTVEYHQGGKVAIITVTLDMMRESCATPEDLDAITPIARRIEGVEAGVTIKEREPGVYRISVRTNGILDACKICARFGGGGHVRAAGCALTGNLESVKAQILSVLDEEIGE